MPFEGYGSSIDDGDVPVVVGVEGFNGTQFVEVLVEVGIAVLVEPLLAGPALKSVSSGSPE